MIDPLFERINKMMKEILEQFEADFQEMSGLQGVNGFRMYWDSSMDAPVIQKFGGTPSGLEGALGTNEVVSAEEATEPLVDVFENKDDNTVEIYVHLPGVTSLEDIAITPAENVIKIEAETPSRKYKKTIELKGKVSSDYEADLNNGVLSLVFKMKKE